MTEEEPPAMVAMRNEPYPREEPDLSIFEDHSAEYGTPDVVNETNVPTTSADMLKQLIRDKNFDDAERLLSELTTVGVKLKPSFCYADAAMNVYRNVGLPQTERLERFTAWWSLIPNASEEQDYNFAKTQGLILGAAHIPDIPIVIRYALIAASKGYAKDVWEKAIPPIARYCPPDISSRFLFAFTAAHRLYLWRVREIMDEYTLKYNERHLFYLALKTYGISGLRGPALTSLRGPLPRLPPEEAASYGFVPNTKTRFAGLGSELNGMLETLSIGRIPPETANWKADEQAALDPDQFDNTLERLMRGFQKKKPPRAPVVAQFIQQCVELNRPGALRELRSIARSDGHHWEKRVSLWALSEMLYYFYAGEYRGLLLTYMLHFQAVGLPLVAGDLRRRKPEDPADYPNFKPFKPLHSSYLARSLGFWPSRKQHALVWKVIVESTESIPALEELYSELIEYIKLSRGRPSSRNYIQKSWAAFRSEPLPMHPNDTNYVQPIPPPMLYDAAHFAPFLKMLAHHKGSNRAFDILSDMHELRIIPSIECITTLCSTLALEGSMDRLGLLLDRMEATDMVFKTYRETKNKKSFPPNTLAPPTIQTYTILIRYLMRQDYVEDAQKVAERLRTKLEYAEGSDELTDEVLKRLDNAVQSKQEELDTQGKMVAFLHGLSDANRCC